MNIALGAYILGTITLLVVKGDAQIGRVRDKMKLLEGYAQVGQRQAGCLSDKIRETQAAGEPHPRRAAAPADPCSPRPLPALQVHNIPDWLKYAMQDHLKLHLSSQEASDDEVLAIYPAAIRRRILQHLYLKSLTDCYLFEVRRRPLARGQGQGHSALL